MRQLLIGVLAAVLCVIPAFAQTTDDTPVIQVMPESVEAGDTVEVRGTGFTAGDTVNATLGRPESDFVGMSLATTQVADDGTFTLSFTMPENWPCCEIPVPITERDLLVIVRSDSQQRASAPITYNVSLAELGWQEHYNFTFNFSLMVPPEWTFGQGADGFSFIIPTPGIQTLVAVVVVTARAVALPQDAEDEAVTAMSLEEYIQAFPVLELPYGRITDITIGALAPVTTASGEEGLVAEWTAQNDSGDAGLSGQTAYFDLNQTVDGTLYRTIQISAIDPAALPFFDAIVSSFRRGHQQMGICDTTFAPAEGEVMDTQSLIQALCATGATVEDGGALPEIAIPIFHTPGQFVIVNGEEMQVYEFADEASAQAVREDTSPHGTDTIIGSREVGWETPPHFFGAGRVIVLYSGDERDVLSALESVLGPQVAGRPMPRLPGAPIRISWEEAQRFILSGQVEFILQTHSLEVQLTLDNGLRFVTTEPSIDEVFRVVEECGDTCLNIGLATE